MKKLFIFLCIAALFLLTVCPGTATSDDPTVKDTKGQQVQDLTVQQVLESLPLPD